MRQEVWFKHDARSRMDPKMTYFLSRWGMEGYGIFWATVEVLNYQNNHEIDLESESLGLAAQFGVTKERLFEVFETLLESGLFTRSENRLFQSKMKQDEAKRSKSNFASSASRASAGRIGGIISGLKRSGASLEQIQLVRSRIEANASLLQAHEANEAEEKEKKDKNKENIKESEAKLKQNSNTHTSQNFESKDSNQNHEPRHLNATGSNLSNNTLPSSQTKGGDMKVVKTKPGAVNEVSMFSKFEDVAESFLEPQNSENPAPWETSNQFIIGGRRPLKKYPELFISKVELCRVLEKYDDEESPIPREYWAECFQAASARIKTMQISRKNTENVSIYNWLTGFIYKEKLEELAASARVKNATKRSEMRGN